jgi:hypothetical protein
VASAPVKRSGGGREYVDRARRAADQVLGVNVNNVGVVHRGGVTSKGGRRAGADHADDMYKLLVPAVMPRRKAPERRPVAGAAARGGNRAPAEEPRYLKYAR